jgi:hypothetical protein
MTTRMPPELMSAEEREARAVELEREVGREWLKYAITETGVITVPFVTYVILEPGTDAESRAALILVCGVALALCSLLTWYWLARRIRPRGAEIEALRGGGDG